VGLTKGRTETCAPHPFVGFKYHQDEGLCASEIVAYNSSEKNIGGLMMHKRKIVLCFTMLLFLLVQTVYANNLFTKIDVIFNQMNLFVNGQKVEADNILYNGTTYVPLRAIAEMLGKDVVWDGATNSVDIVSKGIPSISAGSVTTIEYDDGSLYVGEVRNEMPHGLGIFYYSNGDIYIGEFDNNEVAGDGIIYFKFGDKCIGEFKNGTMQGIGTYYAKDGTIYSSTWDDNEIDGYGTLYFADGGVYVGELKNGMIDGAGIIFYNDGGKLAGEFINDEYIGPINIDKTTMDNSLINLIHSSNSNTYNSVGPGHWISEKIDQGKYIQLEDNSLWEISSLDRYKTSIWLSMDHITVIESENILYPYILVNTSQGETAEAKFVSK
jgi:hypothetical protein